MTSPLGAFTLPGLAPLDAYDVSVLRPTPPTSGLGEPGWMGGPIRLTGRALATVGLQAPALHPDRLILVRAERVSAATS